MYSCIVVGTDGSSTADRAVHAAADVARQNGAALHVVTAFRSGTSGMAQGTGAALVDSGVGGAVRQEAARQVGEEAQTHWGDGLEIQLHQAGGDPADAIVAVADKVGADLIVVGSKGMHGARRVLGSVPNSVSHAASCDVLIVKTD